MEKMNCDIIRDLIPSYVDEVCSQATKECVEKHLETCGECRLIAARCRDNALSGEKLEQKGLDGLKKIKRIMDFQRLAFCLLLLFLILCGFLLFFSQRANYAIFNHTGPLAALCILVVLISGISHRETLAPGRAAYLCGAASLVLSLLAILLDLFLIARLTPDLKNIFGLELYRVGPLMRGILGTMFFAQIAFFIHNLWCAFRHKQNCGWLLCLNIMGIFLTMNYDLTLYLMDTWETLPAAYRNDTLAAVIPGILGIIVSLLLSVKKEK